MKIIFNRKLLCDVFPPLMCAVSNKSTLSAIEGVLIEAQDVNSGGCILTTYDTDKGIRLNVDATIYKPGRYIINAQKFSQIIRVMNGEEIELTVDEKNVVKIVSEKSTYKMSALDGDSFPTLPEIAHEKGFMIEQALLRRMLSKISHAMAVDETRQIFNGCNFKVEGDTLTLVSCDGVNLARCIRKTNIQNKNADGSPLNYSFIVPVKTVNELSKLLSDNEEGGEMTEIYVTRKNIVFIIGGITFFSRLIDGEYIDYNRIILKNHKISAVINKNDLLAALERAALVTEERIAGSVRSNVKLDFTGDILKIMAASSSGSTYDELSTEHIGDDILIAFNNKFLINGIRACGGDNLKLSLSSPLTSMNIEPLVQEENSDELFFMLPVKMKE